MNIFNNLLVLLSTCEIICCSVSDGSRCFSGLKNYTFVAKTNCLSMEQNTINKLKQTEQFMLMLWAFFLIVLYACSFLTEYHFPHEEEVVLGRKVLSDLQRLFFFSLMGMGVLIDLVRMREDRNKAFVFLLLSLLLGGFSGGVGAIQYQVFHFVAGGGQ